jgi:hypothetical protein
MSEIVRERRIQEIEAREALEGTEVKFRIIPESEAKGVIEGYVRAHPGCITSEIIENLKLDPALVVEALNFLEDEGKVKGEEVE